MAMHYHWLTTNPELQPYLRRAREERAAAVYAAWKAVTRGVAAAVGGAIEAVRRARRARRTADALSALSDRQLADIGLTRGEIGSVSRAAAAASPEARATLVELRRAEVAAMPRRRSRLAPAARRAEEPRRAA